MMDRHKLEKKIQKLIDCILFVGLITVIILLIYGCLKTQQAKKTNYMTLTHSKSIRRKFYQLGEKNIILDCIADGNPKPSVKWSHDRHEIDWSSDKKFHLLNGSLEIIDLSSDDSGTYYCEASNGYEAKTIEYLLSVAPFLENLNEKSLNISIEEITSNIFYDITIHCLITDIEKSTITWYHNDTKIDFSNKNKFILGDGSLEVIDLSFKDAGYYKCEGFNKLGKQGLQYNLKVLPSYINYRWISSNSYKASPANYKIVKLDSSFQVRNKKKDEYYLVKWDGGRFTSALVSSITEKFYLDYIVYILSYIKSTHYQLLEVYGDVEWKSVINGTIPSGAVFERQGDEYSYIGKIKRPDNYSVITNVFKNNNSIYYYPSSSRSAENRLYDNNFEIFVIV